MTTVDLSRKRRIVVTHWVEDDVLDLLQSYADVIANRTRETWSRSDVLDYCKDAHAIIVFMPDCIDDTFLATCPNLRIVAGALKGYDNIDVDACTRRGVWVTIVPDLLTAPTAELAVGLLLALTRNIVAGDRLMRQGHFQGWRPVLYGLGLDGAKVGILGFGAVGQMLAHRLAGFDVQIQFHDPKVQTPPHGLEHTRPVDFEVLLKNSDHLVLCAPLNPTSQYLLNEENLKAMKPSATIVNVGRGSVVDEQAVANALQAKHLAGYAADVFELEDYSRTEGPQVMTKDLVEEMDRTVLTPHLGSAVIGTRHAIAHSAAVSLLQALQDQIPANAVNQPIFNQS